MPATTNIQYAYGSRNLWIGCQHVSPACDHCYAEREAARYGHASCWRPRAEYYVCKNWSKDLEAWNRQARKAGEVRRVFIETMGDIFDHRGPAAERDALWDMVPSLDSLILLILTKRSENYAVPNIFRWAGQPVPANIWCGVTVETPAYAARRLPDLDGVQTHVRFVSCEPPFGMIDLRPWIFRQTCEHTDRSQCDDLCSYERRLHWVIAGGESGPKARPTHPSTFRFLREQRLDTETPFFFKQWGEYAPTGDVQSPQTVVCRCGWSGTCNPFVIGEHQRATGHKDFQNMYRVGRERAGRLLDGMEWNQIPVPASSVSPVVNTLSEVQA